MPFDGRLRERKEIVMKIRIKPLGKTVNVPTSHKNMRRVLVLQKQFAAMNNLKDKPAEEVFATQIKAMDAADEFLAKVAGLHKKDLDRLDSMDEGKNIDITFQTADYVCQRLMGQTDQQIKDQNKRVREDPKK